MTDESRRDQVRGQLLGHLERLQQDGLWGLAVAPSGCGGGEAAEADQVAPHDEAAARDEVASVEAATRTEAAQEAQAAAGSEPSSGDDDVVEAEIVDEGEES